MHSIRERKYVAEKIQLGTSITVKKVLYFWSLCNVDSAVTVAACSAVDGVAGPNYSQFHTIRTTFFLLWISAVS